MTFSVMLTVLTITTEYSFSIIKINEIQAIEMVNTGDKNKSGGILTITLKGDKQEQIIHSEHNAASWKKAVKWMNDNIVSLQQEMSTKDLNRHRDMHPGF